MIQTITRQPAAEQLSSVQLREWQRYRGWKIRILEELEHSGGMTTRNISDRIGYRCHSTTNRLVEMQRVNLVERVERWGWRITRDGLVVLSINYTTSSPQQHHNFTTTSPQHDVSGTLHTHTTPKNRETRCESIEEIGTGPACFQAETCHIKRICKDKRYTLRNMKLCHGTASCIWDGHSSPRAPVEMKVVG